MKDQVWGRVLEALTPRTIGLLAVFVVLLGLLIWRAGGGPGPVVLHVQQVPTRDTAAAAVVFAFNGPQAVSRCWVRRVDHADAPPTVEPGVSPRALPDDDTLATDADVVWFLRAADEPLETQTFAYGQRMAALPIATPGQLDATPLEPGAWYDVVIQTDAGIATQRFQAYAGQPRRR